MTRARISKEQYYMNIAREVSERSTCVRAKHGAIVVKNRQIIATGYVGAPRKTKDCFQRENCLRQELQIPPGEQYELCRSVHAEQNVIINAARESASLLGGTMYLYSVRFDEEGKEFLIDACPCFICKKMIINAGIDWFVASRADGSMEKHEVAQWVHDWQQNDMIDDKEQYGK
jgi:dCMP deaminase